MSQNTQISDQLEIAELFARLARLLDDGRYEDVRTVYAEDVVVRSPRGELHGADEVIAFLRRSQVDGEHTQHVHGDVLVDVHGDRADASASQVVHYYRAGEAPHRRSGLRLAYSAVRTPAGWRFQKGHVSLAWAEEG
jgi:limonene-1,2-epoxide hydrolase